MERCIPNDSTVDCAPEIVPIDDMTINKNQLQNCANSHFSDGT